MNLRPLVRIPLLLAVVVAVFVTGGPGCAADGSLNIRALLIWGTNGPKPSETPGQPKLKDLDSKTQKKLRAVFKWKDYYEVSRKDFPVNVAASKRVRMSDKCEIVVRNLNASTVEVKLYGEGKLVVTRKQIMKPGELLVLAGEDKNDTAWFVALSSPEKE